MGGRPGPKSQADEQEQDREGMHQDHPPSPRMTSQNMLGPKRLFDPNKRPTVDGIGRWTTTINYHSSNQSVNQNKNLEYLIELLMRRIDN